MPCRIAVMPPLAILLGLTLPHASAQQTPPARPAESGIKFLDLAAQKHRQVIVDREKGQYLGHP